MPADATMTLRHLNLGCRVQKRWGLGATRTGYHNGYWYVHGIRLPDKLEDTTDHVADDGVWTDP